MKIKDGNTENNYHLAVGKVSHTSHRWSVLQSRKHRVRAEARQTPPIKVAFPAGPQTAWKAEAARTARRRLPVGTQAQHKQIFRISKEDPL